MSKLHIAPDQRRFTLDQQRKLKMAGSAHAYVRGNTVKFYEWLERSSARIPAGPSIWICGDCHTGNLGPVAAIDGKVEIEIRDLDQTVIGNPAHDLLRLGLSLAMSARSSDLPGVTTALMIEAMLEGYVGALSNRRPKPIDTEQVAPLHKVMREALNRKWRHLAEERIEDITPHIPLGRKFWALTGEERANLKTFFEGDKARKLVQCLHQQCDDDLFVKLLDAAYWMKGCSSLGRLRYAALLSVGRKRDRAFRLMDIKEAVAAAAPSDLSAVMPVSNAERIVTGACNLSPFLGERMLASTFAGKEVFIRELRPQDLKFELGALTQAEAVLTARLLAEVVGKAHGRQMKQDERRSWQQTLTSRHTKNLSAPSWLWSSVVDLVADHESAYLEHCRQYALAEVG